MVDLATCEAKMDSLAECLYAGDSPVALFGISSWGDRRIGYFYPDGQSRDGYDICDTEFIKSVNDPDSLAFRVGAKLNTLCPDESHSLVMFGKMRYDTTTDEIVLPLEIWAPYYNRHIKSIHARLSSIGMECGMDEFLDRICFWDGTVNDPTMIVRCLRYLNAYLKASVHDGSHTGLLRFEGKGASLRIAEGPPPAV